MHVRNKKSGISSLHLPQLVNAQHKKIKTFAATVCGHVYIIWSYSRGAIIGVVLSALRWCRVKDALR